MDNGECSYRRYLNGDENAFDDIQNMYFDRLTLFADRYLNDIAAAEDVAIDTLLQLIIHKKRYNFKTSLKTYLYTIAHNRAVNVLKARSRSNSAVMAEDTADRLDLEQVVLETERAKALYKALHKLPADMEKALHLVYFEQLSYKDTAKILGCTVKKVDNLLLRGKAIIKSTLEKEGWQ